VLLGDSVVGDSYMYSSSVVVDVVYRCGCCCTNSWSLTHRNEILKTVDDDEGAVVLVDYGRCCDRLLSCSCVQCCLVECDCDDVGRIGSRVGVVQGFPSGVGSSLRLSRKIRTLGVNFKHSMDRCCCIMYVREGGVTSYEREKKEIFTLIV
jgi:hypothetical protein